VTCREGDRFYSIGGGQAELVVVVAITEIRQTDRYDGLITLRAAFNGYRVELAFPIACADALRRFC